MADVGTGANRLWGSTTQARIGELKRQRVVAASEASGALAADADFPTRASVVRRQRVGVGNAASGVDGTWTLVAGLSDLVALVRTNGRWRDQDTGLRLQLGETERSVVLLDVPAGGNGSIDQVLTTDRISFVDYNRGLSVWQVKEARSNKRDGIVYCRVEYAREDRA